MNHDIRGCYVSEREGTHPAPLEKKGDGHATSVPSH
jgi:hypothetical protein